MPIFAMDRCETRKIKDLKNCNFIFLLMVFWLVLSSFLNLADYGHNKFCRLCKSTDRTIGMCAAVNPNSPRKVINK